MTDRYDVAAVHGRFQPFHTDHLKYVLEAKNRCGFLWVGITQFNISSLVATASDPHRQAPFNNPMTFFERVQTISNCLRSEGVPGTEFACIPFPIETPKYLPDFLPTSVPMFTTVCERWNKDKINLLQEIGYEVIVLWERECKEHEGVTIRRLILEGDVAWEQHVPIATKQAIEKYRIRERLIELEKGQKR